MRRKVVAVIDDNLDILGALGRLLSTLGYDTELYATQEEFLDAAVTTEAICLIVDVHLSDGCGIDFVQELGKSGYGIPTIFMSADHREAVKTRALEVGAAFLAKPFCADVLIKALSSLPPRRVLL